MTNSSEVSERWHILPVDQWPIKHREAWERAISQPNPVRRGGRAASLAAPTRRKLVQVYGSVLWWLSANGRLEPDATPEIQMTRDVVADLIVARRRSYSDNTTYCHVRDLAMMMRCLAPDQDWKWIWQLSVAPRLAEARAARKPPRLFPAGLLMHRLLSELRTAIETPIELLPPDRVRDCLLVAVTVESGIRIRNLVSMRLGRNLVRRKAGWEILFEAYEVKNDQPFLCRLSPALTPFLDRYVAVDLPRLKGDRAINGDVLWLGRKGPSRGRLMPDRIRCIFRQIGQEMLGYPINPHAARHVEATRILNDDPSAVSTAASALAHKDTNTVIQFYDLSDPGNSQAHWLKLVAKVRSGRRRDNPEDRAG